MIKLDISFSSDCFSRLENIYCISRALKEKRKVNVLLYLEVVKRHSRKLVTKDEADEASLEKIGTSPKFNVCIIGSGM